MSESLKGKVLNKYYKLGSGDEFYYMILLNEGGLKEISCCDNFFNGIDRGDFVDVENGKIVKI